MHNSGMADTPLLTPREAARLLGISYPTIKQWILQGKLATVPTPGGHHRIAQASLDPFLDRDDERGETDSRARFRRVSGRNQLAGKVLDVQVDGLMAKVVVAVGKQQITSIITADAVRELELKRGDTVAALVKSTDVMIERLEE
jgi:molybdopterin-binding protein